MKKLLAVLAFASISLSGFAQDANTTEKYSVATNSFWSNWFVQANVAGSAFWGNQEVGNDFSKSPLKGFRNNLGFSVAVGKWFTPGLGLRTKLNGIWGRNVVSTDKKQNADKYWTLNEQVLFNVSNMLCGYNENRLWDCIPYASVGLNRNMSANSYAPVLGVGLLNEFKINNKWAVNLDINYALSTADYDGTTAALAGSKPHDAHSVKGLIANHDRVLNVEVGVTYNLGKATWNKVPDVDAINALHQSELDALNAKLNDANAENDRLKNLLNNQKPVQTNAAAEAEAKYVTTPVSVFFNLGKANVASRKDLVNVQALAKYAKDNNAKLVVNGYADSATGSAAVNQKLSQARAEKVANELVKMGVDKANIVVKANGGVKDLTPASYNRRATVEVAE